MKKSFFAVVAAGLVLAACSKKEEVQTVVTPDATVTETTVVPNSTVQSPVQTPTEAVPTKTYVSEDGKTTMAVIVNGENATVKNEATGKTYELKSISSASGAKYQDAEGNIVWIHQGEMTLGKGEATEFKGKEK